MKFRKLPDWKKDWTCSLRNQWRAEDGFKTSLQSPIIMKTWDSEFQNHHLTSIYLKGAVEIQGLTGIFSYEFCNERLLHMVGASNNTQDSQTLWRKSAWMLLGMSKISVNITYVNSWWEEKEITF